MSDTVEVNTRGLDQLLKALKVKPPIAKVGILGDKNTRTQAAKALSYAQVLKIETPRKSSEQPNNASIGYDHEFGNPTRGLPQRSFLRVPLIDNLSKKIESSGALDKDSFDQVLKTGSILPWMKKIAVLAEGIVIEGFSNSGYGKWAPHSPGYTNNTGQVLVDTAQLRDSITSEVKE